MKNTRQERSIQTSVTNFLHHNKEYLFLLRNKNKRIDPGRLNGIGGKVEPGENYLDAAIRETKEETGYEVAKKDITLSAIVRLEEGYDEDWVMCFFKIKVPTRKIPHGNKTEDGEFLWIHQNEVLNTTHELVDDIKYAFEDIVKGTTISFINARLNAYQKVEKISTSRLVK